MQIQQFLVLLALILATTLPAFAEAPIRVKVDFSTHIRDWDGFGVNYVETAQTRDYKKDPQEYGGFSRLTEKKRQEIMEMILAIGMPGGPEMIFILLVILLLFGAKRIPDLARGFGKGIREFKDATKEIKKEVDEAGDEVKKP